MLGDMAKIFCCWSNTIHFIAGKRYIHKAAKKQKTHKTCLTIHTRSISHHMLLMASGAEIHMRTHNILTCEPKQFQETSCT